MKQLGRQLNKERGGDRGGLGTTRELGFAVERWMACRIVVNANRGFEKCEKSVTMEIFRLGLKDGLGTRK